MQRRDFLKAGAAGVALTLAQGPSQAQVEPRADVKGADAKDSNADLSIVVIGGDGSVPAKTMVDKYLGAHADVWHCRIARRFRRSLSFWTATHG
jgi:hypothetical protein